MYLFVKKLIDKEWNNGSFLHM